MNGPELEILCQYGGNCPLSEIARSIGDPVGVLEWVDSTRGGEGWVVGVTSWLFVL